MIYAGIDVGGKNVHVVLVEDEKIFAKGEALAGIQKAKAAEELYDKVLKEAGLRRMDIKTVVTTGSAGKRVSVSNGYIPDITADARGAIKLVPRAQTVIDIGAEEGRAIKVNAESMVLDFAVNEKCAAGTGTFIETMARALEMPVEEMAKISLKSERAIPMNAQCAVFGESEVVSLIHQKITKPDIARAVHDAIAGRIGSLARIIGLNKDVVAVGGVANNIGAINSLKKEIGMEITVPQYPGFVGAFGAALAAEAGVLGEKVKV